MSGAIKVVRSSLVAGFLLPFLTLGCSLDLNTRLSAETVERVDSKADSSHAQWLGLSFLSGINSAEHFSIYGELKDDSSEVRLHTHFNGFAWRDGVQVILQRRGSLLRLGVRTPGYLPQFVELDGGFIHGGWFRYRIEIHDGVANGIRVLFWNDWRTLDLEVLRARDHLSDQSADFDSLTQEMVFRSHGRGARWGYELKNARVIEVAREAPYVVN